MSSSQLDNLSPHPVLLAPMVGLTHVAVRQALNDFLPAGARMLFPTEMLSSRRLPRQRFRETPEINFDDVAHGLSPQLLGNEEDAIRESVAKLEDWGAKAIDINMGCPVQRALKHNYGVALMGDCDYAARVTAMAVKHAKVPVSVKLRAGMQKDGEFLLRFAKGIENAGASWITLHPRTADQKRRGDADWTQIRLLKTALKIPVIGNGDIQTIEDIEEMFRETSCNRVMVGRALMGKPWLLQEAAVGAQKLSPTERILMYRDFLLKVIRYSREVYSEEVSLRKFGFLVYHGAVWLEFGHFLYKEVRGARTLNAIEALIQEFFEKKQDAVETTERRR